MENSGNSMVHIGKRENLPTLFLILLLLLCLVFRIPWVVLLWILFYICWFKIFNVDLIWNVSQYDFFTIFLFFQNDNFLNFKSFNKLFINNDRNTHTYIHTLAHKWNYNWIVAIVAFFCVFCAFWTEKFLSENISHRPLPVREEQTQTKKQLTQ